MSRNTSQQQDLQLLVEAINNKAEAEAGGVKFIYMDDNTIYRFENNRMKKVSAALLKKASKLAAQDIQQVPVSNPLDNAETAPEQASTPVRKQRSKKVPVPVDEEYSEDEPEQPVKKRNTRKAAKVSAVDVPQVDLNEYWNVKNRNEFMQSELERLNNKVSKLRHYKNIVNRLTGAEYDADIIPNNVPAAQANGIPAVNPQQPLQNVYDSYFNNAPQGYPNNVPQHSQSSSQWQSRTVNDSLFL